MLSIPCTAGEPRHPFWKLFPMLASRDIETSIVTLFDDDGALEQRLRALNVNRIKLTRAWASGSGPPTAAPDAGSTTRCDPHIPGECEHTRPNCSLEYARGTCHFMGQLRLRPRTSCDFTLRLRRRTLCSPRRSPHRPVHRSFPCYIGACSANHEPTAKNPERTYSCHLPRA